MLCFPGPGPRRFPWKGAGALAFLLVALLGMARVHGEPDPGPESVAKGTARTLQVEELDREPIHPLTEGSHAFRVFVFISNDCPIANRYAPEIRRLVKDYSPRGIGFFLVHAAPGEERSAIREHREAYELPGRLLLDPQQALARALGVRVTPEVAVVDGEGRIAYRGRIDDRFPELGKKRPAATRHDLRDALDAVLAGRTVPTPRTRAVGCLLPRVE